MKLGGSAVLAHTRLVIAAFSCAALSCAALSCASGSNESSSSGRGGDASSSSSTSGKGGAGGGGAVSGTGGEGGAGTGGAQGTGGAGGAGGSSSGHGGATGAGGGGTGGATGTGGGGAGAGGGPPLGECDPQPAAGLAAWYRFEESSGVVCDSSGNGNDGVAEGAGYMRAAPGHIGNAIEFNGTDGRVHVPASPTLDMITAGTLEMWIWLADVSPSPKSTVSRGTGNNDNNVLMNASCGNMQTIFTFGGTTNVTSNCNILSAQVWTHIAVVNDGSNLSLYVNGALTTTAPGGFLGPLASDLYIGRREQGIFSYSGRLDEVKWWTVTRTPQQICGDAGGVWMGGSCSLP